MATPEQLAAAKASGYSDEQIQAYLANQNTAQPTVDTQSGEGITQQTAPGLQVQEGPNTDAIEPGQAPVDQSPIAKAKALGYTDEQIKDYLSKQKLPPADKEFQVQSDVPTATGESQPNEVSSENVVRYAHELGVDPTTREGMNSITKRDLQNKGLKWTAKSARDFMANAEEVYDVARPYQWLKSKFGDKADAEYEQLKQQNVTSIVNEAKERGLNIEYDGEQFFTRDNSGKPVAVEPGFLDSIGKSKYELIGGVSGGIAGGIAASRALGPLSQLGPWGRAAAGVITGGAALAGSVAGEQVDYLQARMALQENFDSKLATEKAIGTAQLGIVGEVLGAGTIKLGAVGYRALKSAYQQLAQGSTKRAYELLKQSIGGISDDQVNQIVNSWEQLNKQAAPGKTPVEKAMAILPTTQAGGDTLVAKAATRDLTVATSVSNEVATRAKTLMEATRKLTDDEAGSRILSDLADYTEQVKTSYGIVKQIGADLAPQDYKFNLEKLSIQPILEQKIATVTDQATRDSWIRSLNAIDTATKSRTFEDLLDLRKTLNKLKFKRKSLSDEDFKAIASSLDEVDGEINKVMTKAGASGWLQDWKNVNKSYHEYKTVQDNVLFKAVTKKGTTPDNIANALVKYGTSIDDMYTPGANTYKQVLNKLTAKGREDVEGLIVQKLVKQNTKGTEGFNAIDFPQLVEGMKNFSFTTPNADRLKQAANALAEVYRNDPKLMGLARLGQVDFERGIATTLEGKIRMNILNKTWGTIVSRLPTRQGGEAMLVKKVASLLEDPLNTQTTKQVLADIGNSQSELAKSIVELQAETAKNIVNGTEYNAGKVRLYQDKNGVTYGKPQAGASATKDTIAANRIVPEYKVIEALGKDPKKLSASDKVRLVAEGYSAIGLNDGRIIRIK